MTTTRAQQAEAALVRSHAVGQVAWWRRGPFQDPDYQQQSPRWHLFDSLEEAPLGGLLVKAPCGYRHIFTVTAGEYPRTRTARTPQVSERCERCQQLRP